MRIPEVELVTSGHLACPGCGGALAMRYVLKALGEKTIIALPACCWSIIAAPFPYSSVRVPLIHIAFETAASTASGIRAALDVKGEKDVNVLAWAGDGGTFDIGFQALSGAAERNEDIIYICYDNEAYMNTGIQRSSATPYRAWTTTTPYEFPKEEQKKNIVEIMAAHRIPYTATATVAYPEDLIRKIKKAKEIKGTKFIHILAPCPPGWKIPSEISIKMARLAVHSKVFPIYEVENGLNYTINIEPQGIPVEEYLKPQKRFAHLTSKDYQEIQKRVDQEWEILLRKVGTKAKA
ncbi:MAG: 3-methyl-2-oxobutanoate dehydrogenase subunit beta [Acidobacteria bacterium]|nr:3-methyl-2-oxobutanoate dehydrogenase subunit beta [Acidobacteriota bacterium]